jgi:uncharacterized protein YjcR
MRRPDTRGKTLQRAGSRRQDALPDAWRRAGIGCPDGNQNAVKHGLYTKAAIEERKQLRTLMRDAQKLVHSIA